MTLGYRDVVTTITDAFDRHEVLFCKLHPQTFERLLGLVRRCRQLQQFGSRMLARRLINDELSTLFGVATNLVDDRPLSTLAAVLRHVLMSDVRRDQLSLMPRDRIRADNVEHQSGVTTEEGNAILLMFDQRLNDLAQWYPEHVSLIEMRYFAKLGLLDMALELKVTADHIQRELRFARASLTRVDREHCVRS